MGTRLFAEFQDKNEYNMYYQDMLGRIPKKYHFDFVVFIGRVESTLIAEGESK